MKKLLFALLLLPFITKAQVKTKLYVGGPLATNVYRGPLGSDSALYIMAGCDSPANINVSGFYSVYRGALIYKDTCNDAIYTSNPDASWTRIINSSGDIYIDGDTIVINNIKVVNKLRIPLTDTTTARKGCGNIIYDTINEHYYGDVCINGVHYAWQCFDCISGSGTISEITATNNYAQTWTITNPNGPTTNLSLVLDTTLLSTRANVDSKTITLNQGSNVTITGNPTQNLGQNPSWTIAATTSGGSTNSNIGSGYRWAVPNTNNIKTFFGANAIILDSSTNADALTAKWGGTLTGNTTVTGAGFYSAFSGGRLEAGQGAAVAAANDLTLGNDGNTFSITGATQINAITTTNWQAGSVVNLIFASTPTVKNNTAGGAGTAVILLASAADFTAAANDVLTLVYDGTSWHETSRKQATSGGQFWRLASGGTLTGVNTIDNSRISGLIFNGTATATANTQAMFDFTPSLTARNTASDVFSAINISPTLTWAANLQKGTAIYINPTFTQGGFSGTSRLIQLAIQHNGSIQPITTNAWNLGNLTNLYNNTFTSVLTTNNIQNITTATTILVNDQSGMSVAKFYNGGSQRNYSSAGFEVSAHADIGTSASYMLTSRGEAYIKGALVIPTISTPSAPTVTATCVSGCNQTWSYKVVARLTNGKTTDASPAGSTALQNASLSGSNFNIITITPVEGARFYDIYRTVAVTSPSTTGKIGTVGANSNTFTDNNVAGDGSTPPSTNVTGVIATGTTSPTSMNQFNGSFALGYVAKSGTYTATEADQTIDCTSGTFTVTLPTAVGCQGRVYTVVNSGAGTITIGTTSSQTFVNINATPTTLTLAAVGAGAITSYTVMSNNANWIVTGKVKNE